MPNETNPAAIEAATPTPRTDAEFDRLRFVVEPNEVGMESQRDVALFGMRDFARMLEGQLAKSEDALDMHRDEFQRIVALRPSDEIVGLCKRAILSIGQTVPVIEQRDKAQSRITQLERELAAAQAELDAFKKPCGGLTAEERFEELMAIRDELLKAGHSLGLACTDDYARVVVDDLQKQRQKVTALEKSNAELRACAEKLATMCRAFRYSMDRPVPFPSMDKLNECIREYDQLAQQPTPRE